MDNHPVAGPDPRALHATAALWSLRKATEVYLVDLVGAGGVGGRAPERDARPRRRAALDRWDALLRTERVERLVNDQAGIHQVGASAGPVDAGLLDAQALAAQALVDAGWLVQSALAGRPLLAWSDGWLVLAAGDHRRARLAWLTIVVPLLAGAAAVDVAELLAAADRRVRAACQLTPADDQEPIATLPPCPACQDRLLIAQVAAPTPIRWTVVCTGRACICRGPGGPLAGDGCSCRMPTRIAGVRHIWVAGDPNIVAYAEYLAWQWNAEAPLDLVAA